jgi:preprotein translocase subunit SecA
MLLDAPAIPDEYVPQESGRPTKRFNALGILEDVPAGDLLGGDVSSADAESVGAEQGAADEPVRTVAKGAPTVVGAGRVRSLADGAGGAMLPPGWEQTARNDACPCGSGKKFKKCHGANL